MSGVGTVISSSAAGNASVTAHVSLSNLTWYVHATKRLDTTQTLIQNKKTSQAGQATAPAACASAEAVSGM